MITSSQKHIIDAIVSIHETGKLPTAAAYSTITVLSDGAGISYGKHQSTDKSGSLDAILHRYCDKGGCLTNQIKPFFDLLAANESTKVDPKNLPAWVRTLKTLLAEAGKDPVMQAAQDEVFDENYWIPATQKCAAMGLVTALSHLAVYDTIIHSGPTRVDRLRSAFAEVPPARGGGEQAWVLAFLQARKKWLQSNSNPLVVNSAYRVDAMLKLPPNWELTPPFTYRNVYVPG
jgi:chitosanase